MPKAIQDWPAWARKHGAEGDPDACWPWRGMIDRNTGYGKTSVKSRPELHGGAHRAVYQILVGPIPAGLDLDHLCHNADTSCPGGPTCLHRRCVNPRHLEPASRQVNRKRGRTSGMPDLNRAKTHCPKGHPYSGDNLIVRIKPQGWQARICRTCERARHKRRRR